MQIHLVLAALMGLGLRLFFVLHFPMVAGDTPTYEELARNWLDHRVYGLFISGVLTPVDLRAPGYPACLAAIYAVFGRTRLAVMLVQAVIDVVTCFLTAALAARLVTGESRQRVALAALWLAATSPFVANYAAVPLTEVLATFLTTLALLALLHAASERGFYSARAGSFDLTIQDWFLAGILVGLGALTRPETPLILVAAALVLAARWRRPRDWSKLVRAGALLGVGLLVPLLPWAARNWRTLHHVQFLAPRYSQMPGEVVPRGFYAWTGTWLTRFRDVYLVPWKLEEEPIRIEDLPGSAFDSPEERARVAALLDSYNASLSLSPELDQQFAQLAQERTARHPLRAYLRVPLARMATMWFTPRVELLPYSGHLWPLGQKWHEDPVDFSLTIFFGFLNFLYVGLALAGIYVATRQPRIGSEQRWSLALLVVFILVRTAFLTTIETPEPRYVVVCFPAVLAIAALVCARPHLPSLGFHLHQRFATGRQPRKR